MEWTNASPSSVVGLNPLDSTLDAEISENRLDLSTLSQGGFGYMWSGSRAALGITGGRYYFKCLVKSLLPVSVTNTTELDCECRCRIGVSHYGSDVGSLGENLNSWGYENSGKACHGNVARAYGEAFAVRDEITCMVDLTNEPGIISFAKNSKLMGVAFKVPLPKGGEGALFPHVLVKNVAVKLEFESPEEVGGIVAGRAPTRLLNGHEPWKYALTRRSCMNTAPQSPVRFSDCEVLMLVGLPGTGKTTWAEKYVKQNPEKRTLILDTTLVLSQMRALRLAPKLNYIAEYSHASTVATEVFNELLSRAAKLPRNYILDQTNVFENARVRKLKMFTEMGFLRKAVVFIIPDEVLFQRQQKQHREEGKFVPDQAIAEMKGNFTIPTKGAMFESVIFAERAPPEIYPIIEEQKQSSKLWLMHNKRQELEELGRDVAKQPVELHAPVMSGLTPQAILPMDAGNPQLIQQGGLVAKHGLGALGMRGVAGLNGIRPMAQGVEPMVNSYSAMVQARGPAPAVGLHQMKQQGPINQQVSGSRMPNLQMPGIPEPSNHPQIMHPAAAPPQPMTREAPVIHTNTSTAPRTQLVGSKRALQPKPVLMKKSGRVADRTTFHATGANAIPVVARKYGQTGSGLVQAGGVVPGQDQFNRPGPVPMMRKDLNGGVSEQLMGFQALHSEGRLGAHNGMHLGRGVQNRDDSLAAVPSSQWQVTQSLPGLQDYANNMVSSHVDGTVHRNVANGNVPLVPAGSANEWPRTKRPRVDSYSQNAVGPSQEFMPNGNAALQGNPAIISNREGAQQEFGGSNVPVPMIARQLPNRQDVRYAHPNQHPQGQVLRPTGDALQTSTLVRPPDNCAGAAHLAKGTYTINGLPVTPPPGALNHPYAASSAGLRTDKSINAQPGQETQQPYVQTSGMQAHAYSHQQVHGQQPYTDNSYNTPSFTQQNPRSNQEQVHLPNPHADYSHAWTAQPTQNAHGHSQAYGYIANDRGLQSDAYQQHTAIAHHQTRDLSSYHQPTSSVPYSVQQSDYQAGAVAGQDSVQAQYGVYPASGVAYGGAYGGEYVQDDGQGGVYSRGYDYSQYQYQQAADGQGWYGQEGFQFGGQQDQGHGIVHQGYGGY